MECSVCHKTFKSKLGCEHHIKNGVCLKRYKKCSTCGKVFNDKRNLQYHLDHNVCRQNNSKKILKLKSYVNFSIISKEELYEENMRLKGQIESLEKNPRISNSNNNNIIVVPPAFLSLDTCQDLLQRLPDLLHNAISHHPSDCISYLIKETNCNPSLPMYNSIKITNKKDNFLQISNGEKYVYASKKQIIDQLIENKRHLLQEYIDQKGDKYGEKILQRYQRYVDALDDTKDERKELENEVIIMILNISEVIGSDDWSRKLLEDLKRES